MNLLLNFLCVCSIFNVADRLIDRLIDRLAGRPTKKSIFTWHEHVHLSNRGQNCFYISYSVLMKYYLAAEYIVVIAITDSTSDLIYTDKLIVPSSRLSDIDFHNSSRLNCAHKNEIRISFQTSPLPSSTMFCHQNDYFGFSTMKKSLFFHLQQIALSFESDVKSVFSEIY